MQVNNLKIRFDKDIGKYEVITPNQRILEEFDKLDDAIQWCKETRDFVVTKEKLK